MTIIKPNTSTVIVTAPRPLTSEQVDNVRAEIARQVPAGVAVVVVPHGFTVQLLESPACSADVRRDFVDLVRRDLGALSDMQESIESIAAAVGALGSATMRVTP